MSSSTSSSESGIWRGFAVLWLAAALVVTAAILAAAFLLDPYDTGRPGLFAKPGVRPQGPRTAAASRGRDPAFDSAIFGNSHVQLLSPERLGELGAGRFVSLIAPATRPKEQFVLLDWFLRHHARPKAILMGIDGFWCTGDPALPNEKPFPFWLYERALPKYVAGLLRYDLLEEAPRRISYLTGRRAERARPDGFWDYEANYLELGFDRRPDKRADLEKPASIVTPNASGRYPAAGRLADAMARAPAETVFVLLHPPGYATGLPAPGSPAAAADQACKAAFAAVAAARPRTVVIDWRRDGPEVRDPALWFDHTHYRTPVARRIEAEVAAAIRKFPTD